MVTHTLTRERVAEIAAIFGVSVESITGDVAQAVNAHGQPCGGNSDKPIVSWGTDSNGIYDAEKLLIGYIEQNQMEQRIDERAMVEFHENAYGSDY